MNEHPGPIRGGSERQLERRVRQGPDGRRGRHPDPHPQLGRRITGRARTAPGASAPGGPPATSPARSVRFPRRSAPRPPPHRRARFRAGDRAWAGRARRHRRHGHSRAARHPARRGPPAESGVRPPGRARAVRGAGDWPRWTQPPRPVPRPAPAATAPRPGHRGGCHPAGSQARPGPRPPPRATPRPGASSHATAAPTRAGVTVRVATRPSPAAQCRPSSRDDGSPGTWRSF